MSKNRKASTKEVHLESFGSVTGLLLERGMCVEVLMTWPEVTRILDAYIVHEKGKEKPNVDMIASIRKVTDHVSKQDVAFRAAVVIAQHRAKITPVVTPTTVEDDGK